MAWHWYSVEYVHAWGITTKFIQAMENGTTLIQCGICSCLGHNYKIYLSYEECHDIDTVWNVHIPGDITTANVYLDQGELHADTA